MQREVVQDFLNLPGIEGVALVDGRSRPYFCGVDQTLNFQQKEALAQGIQQVVETTPPDFEFFEFQFTGHQVYIYKLDHGVILLVLTSDHLIYPAYVRAVEKLKLELQDDITNAIATFRLLAGKITLSGHDYWKRGQGLADSPLTGGTSAGYPSPSLPSPSTHPQNGKVGPVASSSAPPAVVAPPAEKPRPQAVPVNLTADSPTPTPPAAPPVAPPQPTVVTTAPPATPTPVAALPPSIEEVVQIINHISQFTKQYLGTTVVSNYWKSSRPAEAWLTKFEVDRAGKWSFAGGNLNATLTEEQTAWMKQWIAAFSKRCAVVIRDFPILLRQSDISDRLKDALLPK